MVTLLAEAHARQVCFVSAISHIEIVLRHHQLILQILWWLLPFLGLGFTYWHLALSFSLFTWRCNLLFLNAEVVTILVVQYFVDLLFLRIISLLVSALAFGECFS